MIGGKRYYECKLYTDLENEYAHSILLVPISEVSYYYTYYRTSDNIRTRKTPQDMQTSHGQNNPRHANPNMNKICCPFSPRLSKWHNCHAAFIWQISYLLVFLNAITASPFSSQGLIRLRNKNQTWLKNVTTLSFFLLLTNTNGQLIIFLFCRQKTPFLYHQASQKFWRSTWLRRVDEIYLGSRFASHPRACSLRHPPCPGWPHRCHSACLT